MLRWVGEAALWQHRLGNVGKAPDDAAELYALQVAGRWREAAAAWAALGRPYNEADALADAPEPEPLLAALAMLDRLGAVARAAIVRRRLTEMGVPAYLGAHGSRLGPTRLGSPSGRARCSRCWRTI